MKRIIIIIISLLSLASICFAENQRWDEIFKDGDFVAYIDTYNVKVVMKDNKKCLETWIKYGIKDSYLIEHTYIDTEKAARRELSYSINESVFYRNNQYVSTENRSEKGWLIPTPGSRLEGLLIGALDWSEDKINKSINPKEHTIN